MLTEELLEYVKKRIAEGAPTVQIRTELRLNGGWTESDIIEAIASASVGRQTSELVTRSVQTVPTPVRKRRLPIVFLLFFIVALAVCIYMYMYGQPLLAGFGIDTWTGNVVTAVTEYLLSLMEKVFEYL